MRIESVTGNDAAQLLAIYAPYVEKTAITFEYEVPSPEDFARRIAGITAKYPFLKAVDEAGNILGYAYGDTFKDRAAYDWSVETTVYVRQDCRRAGVGRRLYEELEEQLRDMGICNMNACIAIPREGQEDARLTDASRLFHRSLGFEPAGHFHNSGYKFGTWYDMVWMEKLIGSHGAEQSPVRFKKRDDC